MTIAAADLERRLSGIVPIGRSERGTSRLAWTAEDAAATAWFEAQAAEVGLEVGRDPAGSLWAMPSSAPPWWGVGSHLDSVLDGGSFDGALGVAIGFEVAARSSQPLAVISFADEEGARYNTPTFGSRALVGRLDVEEALARRDADGTSLREATAAAGVDPEAIATAPRWLGRLRGFLEAHIDQSRDTVAAGAAVGVVSGLASRLRVELRIEGAADHAGTTPIGERRDALLAAARLIVGAAEDAGEGGEGLVVTASRILVEPNALTTIPHTVRLWMDARAASPEAVASWRAELVERVAALDGEVAISIRDASRSDGTPFASEVREALRAAGERLGLGVHESLCFAGHDAGILAERIPAGMVLVPNPSGISHAPEEAVALADAAHAATVMLGALEALA